MQVQAVSACNVELASIVYREQGWLGVLDRAGLLTKGCEQRYRRYDECRGLGRNLAVQGRMRFGIRRLSPCSLSGQNKTKTTSALHVDSNNAGMPARRTRGYG